MYRHNAQQKKKQIQYSNGTIFNAFIYLKYKDDSYQNPKKIKYPSSIPNLMRLAKTLFADEVDVQSIFTKNGKKIEYIDDVIPGDTLYVSPITGKEEDDEIKVSKKRVSIKEEKEKNKLHEQASYNKLFGGSDSTENERVKVKVVGNPHLSLSKNRDKSGIPTFKVRRSENANSNADQDDRKSQDSRNQFQSSSSMDKSKRKRSNNLDDMYSFSSGEEHENDKDGLNKTSSESFNSNRKNKRNNMNSTESDLDGQNKNSRFNRNNSAWFKASEEERRNLTKDAANLSQIFQKVLHEDTLAEKVPESLYNLYNEDYEKIDTKDVPVPIDFYKQLTNISKSLDFYWIKKGIELFDRDPNEDSEIFGLDEIRCKIQNIITKHRKPFFQSSENNNKNQKGKQNKDSKNKSESEKKFYSGIGYQFNLAITGPRKSGKSTFLSLFARELLFEFVATESLKKYFFLNLDLSNFIINIKNPDIFFHKIVDATLNSLQWHSPCYTPYIQSLSIFFKSITDETEDDDSYVRNPPLVPPNFKYNPDFQHVAASFQSIVNRMTCLWENDEKFLEWNLSVLFFPYFIAQAVGIEKMIYIVDNIELFDIKVNSTSCTHFNSYNNCIFLSDVFKVVLSTGNFIISCQNQNDFIRFLEPITEEFDSSDFKNKIEYLSTLDLIDVNQQNNEEEEEEEENLYQDKIISAFLDLEDEEIPIYISINHTGGVPAFVFLWKEINKLFDELEKYDENSIEYHEIYPTIFSQATELLYQLFVSQDGQDISSSIDIVKVKRSSSSEK